MSKQMEAVVGIALIALLTLSIIVSFVLLQ